MNLQPSHCIQSSISFVPLKISCPYLIPCQVQYALYCYSKCVHVNNVKDSTVPVSGETRLLLLNIGDLHQTPVEKRPYAAHVLSIL